MQAKRSHARCWITEPSGQLTRSNRAREVLNGKPYLPCYQSINVRGQYMPNARSKQVCYPFQSSGGHILPPHIYGSISW